MILGVTFTLASMSVHPQDVPATKTIITVGDTPLILRSSLFGNPVKFGALLSPDGKWVSWIAPVNGLLNVWVAPSEKPEVGKAITASTDHPISTHFWSSDSNQILFIKDNGGDENFHLYGVDIITGKQQDYTPFANVSIKVIGVSSKRQNELLVGINNRDPRWHDVYLLNIKTGKRKLLLKGDGFINFQSDDDLQLRLVGRPNVVGGHFGVAERFEKAHSSFGDQRQQDRIVEVVTVVDMTDIDLYFGRKQKELWQINLDARHGKAYSGQCRAD